MKRLFEGLESTTRLVKGLSSGPSVHSVQGHEFAHLQDTCPDHKQAESNNMHIKGLKSENPQEKYVSKNKDNDHNCVQV